KAKVRTTLASLLCLPPRPGRMSFSTFLLYAATLGLWMWAVHREGGIGAGVRFMYAFSLVNQFLVGPPLYFISGLSESDPDYRGREEAVQLVLFSLIGFVIGAYFLVPPLLRRPRLRLDQEWRPWAAPDRLETEWRVGQAL